MVETQGVGTEKGGDWTCRGVSKTPGSPQREYRLDFVRSRDRILIEVLGPFDGWIEHLEVLGGEPASPSALAIGRLGLHHECTRLFGVRSIRGW